MIKSLIVSKTTYHATARAVLVAATQLGGGLPHDLREMTSARNVAGAGKVVKRNLIVPCSHGVRQGGGHGHRASPSRVQVLSVVVVGVMGESAAIRPGLGSSGNRVGPHEVADLVLETVLVVLVQIGSVGGWNGCSLFVGFLDKKTGILYILYYYIYGGDPNSALGQYIRIVLLPERGEKNRFNMYCRDQKTLYI